MLLSVALAAAILLTAQALIVAALAALRPRGNIYMTIIAVAIATAPIVFFSDRLLFGRAADASTAALFLVLVHLALGGFLFHFITLPDRSVTLRIFVELDGAPGRALSLAASRADTACATMIASRLEQLAEGAFIGLTGRTAP